MSILRRVERELDERIRRFFAASPDERGREVLELQRAILDQVTARVESIGRGRRVFPFRHLAVHIALPAPDEQPVYAMAFVEGGRLAADIRDALRETGVEPPPDLRVEVSLEAQEIRGGFQIVYHERPPAPATPAVAPPATLTIVTGQAAQPSYALGAARVNVGRLADVVDESQRLVRRNQVAFAESTDPVTATVSRAHAHIQYDAATGEYRIFDDHSAYGTTVFRGGELLTIPAGASRGVALRPGDEIYFGQARARFEQL